MIPTILKWVVIVLALVNAGYMTYDGTRAIITGDYIRPKTGEYAGQLGPWTRLAEKIGIDPMSTLMKSIFICFGVAGFIIATGYALNLQWAWKAMIIYNICSLWNLFFGTANSILQLILLVIIRFIK